MQPKTKSMTTLINHRIQPSCVLKQAIIMAAGRSNKNKYKQRMLSFSYYPGYIRAMHVNFDGINQPPTELDVFFHTLEPLPEAGMKLLETIDKMHENQYELYVFGH